MSSLAQAVDGALAPADALRRALYARLGPLRPLLVDRELRVALGGLGTALSSAALALLCPLWSLALGPIVLGVPHLLSDVRYLVARPALHRRRELWLAMGLPLLAATLWPLAWVGVLATLGALGVARGPLGRRLPALALASGLYAVAYRFPTQATLAAVHLHNAVAVLAWWAWRARRSAWHLLPLAAVVGLAALLYSPALDGLYAHAPTWTQPATGAGLGGWLDYTALGVNGPLCLRLLVGFAFAQSVHYGLWLRLVPDDDRARPTPRSFRASFAALRADLGGPALALLAALALGVALWGALDLTHARDGYLRLAACHAYLELAALALAWVEGRRPGCAAPPSGGAALA